MPFYISVWVIAIFLRIVDVVELFRPSNMTQTLL